MIKSLPRLVDYALCPWGIDTIKVQPIEVGMITRLVPLGAGESFSVVVTTLIVVSVLGSELHAIMVGKAISTEPAAVTSN